MAFIQGALDKEIRLSFAQRIKGTLPDPYPKLITPGKEKDTPDFKYSSERNLPTIRRQRTVANLTFQWHHTPKKDKNSCS
jgi:hypothetical protein